MGRASLYHPAFGGVVSYEETIIPDDPDGQVAATVALMRRYAIEDALSPEVLETARRLKQQHPDEAGYIAACFSEVKSSTRFVDDASLYSLVPGGAAGTITVETLIRPRDLLAMSKTGERQGDCDDYSMLLASLLAAGGVPCSFVTVAADSGQPDRFSHVYIAAYPKQEPGVRIPLDASHGPCPGWETEQRFRIQEFPVNRSPNLIPCLALGLVGYALVKSLEGRP